jgi:putative transposase
MPRKPRLEIPGIPLHIVQRGVNRVRIFEDDADRRRYLELLDAARKQHDVAIHAYVLMTNHVHLLVSASTRGAVSTVMHRVGTSYVQVFNRRHDRVGALWQGRFKSCLVDHDRYLVAVYRYIELNPVRAGIVDRPEAHRWSSVHGDTGLGHDPLLTPHPAFLATAPDAATCARRHREALREALPDDITDAIRRHTAQQCALGPEYFQAEVGRHTDRPVNHRPRGRPRKKGTRPIS